MIGCCAAGRAVRPRAEPNQDRHIWLGGLLRAAGQLHLRRRRLLPARQRLCILPGGAGLPTAGAQGMGAASWCSGRMFLICFTCSTLCFADVWHLHASSAGSCMLEGARCLIVDAASVHVGRHAKEGLCCCRSGWMRRTKTRPSGRRCRSCPRRAAASSRLTAPLRSTRATSGMPNPARSPRSPSCSSRVSSGSLCAVCGSPGFERGDFACMAHCCCSAEFVCALPLLSLQAPCSPSRS